MLKSDVLSKNIKNCRQKLGMTQSQLAEKLYISAQAISKWEAGQSMPDIENLIALADVFSTSVDNLIGYKPRNLEGEIFLGIDGGATKTEFVLFSESGHILNRITLEGSNPNVYGFEKVCAILKSGIDTMLHSVNGVSGAFAGIAGAMSGDNLKKLEKFFQSTYPMMKTTVGSDIFNVISCASEVEKCAVAICGTGFVIYANTNEKLQRVEGWGYLLSDISGGYGLGREALKAALAYEDGFGEKTVLTDLVQEKLQSKTWDAIGKIYSGGDSFIASFSPLVFEAYMQEDKVAMKILDQYTDQMAELLAYTIRAYDCDDTIVMAGGLLSKDGILATMLKEKLGDKVRFIVPEFPQIYGACRRACSLYGTIGEEFDQNFFKTLT